MPATFGEIGAQLGTLASNYFAQVDGDTAVADVDFNDINAMMVFTSKDQPLYTLQSTAVTKVVQDVTKQGEALQR